MLPYFSSNLNRSDKRQSFLDASHDIVDVFIGGLFAVAGVVSLAMVLRALLNPVVPAPAPAPTVNIQQQPAPALIH